MAGEYDLLESIPDAVLVTDVDGVITFANRLAEEITGYSRAEILGTQVEMLVPERARSAHVEQRRGFYHKGAGRTMGDPSGDVTLRRKDGTEVPVEVSLGPVGDATVAVVRDFSRHRRIELELEHRALHDPLTNLPNRALFFDRLTQAMRSSRREGLGVAVVMLDLDGFKALNDTYGHAFGDEVLRKFADSLGRGLRATDTVARIGGDEFAWILPAVTSRAAVDETVRKRLDGAIRQVSESDRRSSVGVSAGIALYPEDGRNADALMRHADAAMYQAKRQD